MRRFRIAMLLAALALTALVFVGRHLVVFALFGHSPRWTALPACRSLGVGRSLARADAGRDTGVHQECVQPISGTLVTQSAYVWQRAWTPAVVDAITNRPAGLSKLLVLAAQVDWDGQTPHVVRVRPDYAALAASGSSIGLALRIAARRAPLNPGEPAVEQMATLARDLIEHARAAGLEPAELQVDYDSAETRLGEYQAWLAVLRRAVAPVPLTITVLPCWLRHRDFAPLVRATDGFVLQVHSLARPAALDSSTSLSLIDVGAAHDAVRRAAALDVPFEVALPTYGYQVAFNSEGLFLGLNAEGPSPKWPRDAVLRDVRTDPAAMAALVREWSAHRPRSMRGVIWYRLPITGDRHNWSRETLACVMRGQTPQPQLAAKTSTTDEGRLVDIALVNTGTAGADLGPVQVDFRLDPAMIEAQDGLAGFSSKPSASGITFAARGAGVPFWLQPGECCAVGWVRLLKAGGVRVEVGHR